MNPRLGLAPLVAAAVLVVWAGGAQAASVTRHDATHDVYEQTGGRVRMAGSERGKPDPMVFIDITAVRTQLSDATLTLAVTTRAPIAGEISVGGQLRTDGVTYGYDVYTRTGEPATFEIYKGDKSVSCMKAAAKQTGVTFTITIPRHCLGQTKHVRDSLVLEDIDNSGDLYSDTAYVGKTKLGGDPTFGPKVGLG